MFAFLIDALDVGHSLEGQPLLVQEVVEAIVIWLREQFGLDSSKRIRLIFRLGLNRTVLDFWVFVHKIILSHIISAPILHIVFYLQSHSIIQLILIQSQIAPTFRKNRIYIIELL